MCVCVYYFFSNPTYVNKNFSNKYIISIERYETMYYLIKIIYT